MDVAGYGACRLCDSLAPLAVLMRSGWVCGLCMSREIHPASRVRVDNAVLNLPPRQRSGSKGSSASKKAGRLAKQAAQRRLAKAFPGVYRVLLAEERAARGLEPYPVVHDPDLRPDQLEREMLAAGRNVDEQIYAALARHGIGVDS